MGEASLSKGQPGLSWASDTLGPLSGEYERPEEKLPPAAWEGWAPKGGAWLESS